jgi:hypothetical protein
MHPPSGPSGSGITAGLISTTATNEDGTITFTCSGCAQYNTVNVAKDIFYVVTAGTSVGIFKDSVSSFTISTVYPHNGWLMNLLSPGTHRLFCHGREVLGPKKILQP